MSNPLRPRDPGRRVLERSQPPVVTAHEIVRLRLLDRLTSASTNVTTARLILVRGPAGFGKTTLLAQAYRQVVARAGGAVWLDCSELTGDAQSFVDSLYAAAGFTGIDKSEVEFTPSDLAARLAAIDPAIFLFLDEFERLVGTPVETAVERLTLALPGTAQVVVSSRQALRSWFLQRELAGLAATVEPLDLRFTGEELRSLLSERFSAEDLMRVEQLTEGWPMAVQLARLRSRDMSGAGQLLAALRQGGHGLFEYLAERVVESLSSGQRDFLRDTSILPFVNPLAANAVMERDDGYALLASVIHLQPIVTVTGDAVLTVRLHPLFRQYMRDQLARSGHQRECELHRRAATHFSASGQTFAAVQHALEAEDPALAIALMDRAGGEELVFTIGPPKVHILMESIPTPARDLSLRFRLMELTMAAVDGRTAYAAELAARFEAALDAREREPGESGPSADWLTFARRLTRVLIDFLEDLHRGCSEGALTNATWLEWFCRQHFASEPSHLGFVLAMEVLLFARHGRLEDMRRCLNDYHELCERNGFAPNLPSINPQRGLLAFLSGDFDAARTYFERTADIRLDRFAEPEILMVRLSKVLIAVMFYERARVEDAQAVLAGLRTDLDAGFSEILALDLRMRSLCAARLEGPEAADAILAEAFRQARQRGAQRLVSYLRAVRLQLASARGIDSALYVEDFEASRTLLASELARSDPSWLFLDQCARAVIPIVATSQPAAATDLAARLVELAAAQGRRHLEAVARILLARATLAIDAEAAVAALSAALELTARSGALGLYEELGAPLAPHLMAALGHAPTPMLAEHVREILRFLDGTVATESAGWKTLSERERDIMLVLAAHASTKAVARELGLAPETVKHHLKRIYAKLGVHTRDEALARVAHPGE